jgi:RNA polymerase sigma factor (TIGR02999 family)
MSDVTQILAAVQDGDLAASERLLPLVYGELRKLASQRLTRERPGQTLDATALVHEAYLRLVGDGQPRDWNGRGHFFGAAAEAMRRILVERARRRNRAKHGGGRNREPITLSDLAAECQSSDVLALDEALDRLAAEDQPAAELVKLRFFAGLTIPEAAAALGVSPRNADFIWAYARAWLRRELGEPQ